jgi:hypothetical protein
LNAGAAGDAASVTELATDASKAAAITADVSKAAVTQDAGRAAAAAKDGTEAGTAGGAEKPCKGASKLAGRSKCVNRGSPEIGHPA